MVSVYQARLNQGKILAERILDEWPDRDIDAVIPIPDSGRIEPSRWLVIRCSIQRVVEIAMLAGHS